MTDQVDAGASEPVRLSLPYPPSVNHYWFRRGYRIFVGARGKRFREEVRAVWLASGAKEIRGPVTAALAIAPPDERRRDLDNVVKATFDALEFAGAFRDDSAIDAFAVVRLPPSRPGRCEVLLAPGGVTDRLRLHDLLRRL